MTTNLLEILEHTFTSDLIPKLSALVDESPTDTQKAMDNTLSTLLVFGLGLHATPQDATSLLRRPGLLFRSLLAMNIVVPLFAAVLAAECQQRDE